MKKIEKIDEEWWVTRATANESTLLDKVNELIKAVNELKQEMEDNR